MRNSRKFCFKFNCHYDGCEQRFTSKEKLDKHSEHHDVLEQETQAQNQDAILDDRELTILDIETVPQALIEELEGTDLIDLNLDVQLILDS